MNKIEYKTQVNGKSVTKEVGLIDLNWQDFCKATDLAISLENPNGSQFTDVSQLVQIHTGKTDQEMMEWKNSCRISCSRCTGSTRSSTTTANNN